MSAVICPTILTTQAHGFRSQLERIEPFAKRIQIDLADGQFTQKTIELGQIYWPDSLEIDLHMMYQKPQNHVEKLVDLRPHMVIAHKEADADLLSFAEELHEADIDFGVALLPETLVETAREEIYVANHVLIFGGKLGSFGGHANLEMLNKVGQIRAINPSIEIGWDGGVNDENARQLVEAGIDVLNVGSYIQRSEKPQEAYAILKAIVEDVNND